MTFSKLSRSHFCSQLLAFTLLQYSINHSSTSYLFLYDFSLISSSPSSFPTATNWTLLWLNYLNSLNWPDRFYFPALQVDLVTQLLNSISISLPRFTLLVSPHNTFHCTNQGLMSFSVFWNALELGHNLIVLWQCHISFCLQASAQVFLPFRMPSGSSYANPYPTSGSTSKTISSLKSF